MEGLVIHREQPADQDAIGAVLAAAFAGHPHSHGAEPSIVAALREQAALALSLVAVGGGHVLGCLAFSPVVIADGSTGWYGLGPLAVQPACQGRGIATALVTEGLRQIRGEGAAGCIVLGEPAYYGRFGFRAGTGLSLPGVPASYFMALPFGASIPTGEVRYHPAFLAQA
ncbi:MAG TPA: N-acetyltransferase [Geminicoccus sp.]|jgi:putative acetyltransferase|uniref:GNAT family N-acetyltransferase n=1 Tax=Geminicoccus sp. TaxID=2024832 RepID=UPI002E37FDEA|nr:N-acetyltransferase [Geminicoccus sp.]HEX2526208.1 N-acetyltransferase [Geminicoccus sp.]